MLAENVYFKLEQFKNQFKSFKKLKRLDILNGHFLLKMTELFQPVEDLRLGCFINPSVSDVLSIDSLNCLRILKISKLTQCTLKIEKILYLLEFAPHLTKLELDLNKEDAGT